MCSYVTCSFVLLCYSHACYLRSFTFIFIYERFYFCYTHSCAVWVWSVLSKSLIDPFNKKPIACLCCKNPTNSTGANIKFTIISITVEWRFSIRTTTTKLDYRDTFLEHFYISVSFMPKTFLKNLLRFKYKAQSN